MIRRLQRRNDLKARVFRRQSRHSLPHPPRGTMNRKFHRYTAEPSWLGASRKCE
jgi:hypothetical protein